MWFKTQVGLTSVQESAEILVGQSTDAGTKRWWIYARTKSNQEGNAKGFLGNASSSNPISYLAMFLDGQGCQQAIGECMSLIEMAIQDETKLCDLCGVGDAQAWSQNWHQVQWQH